MRCDVGTVDPIVAPDVRLLTRSTLLGDPPNRSAIGHRGSGHKDTAHRHMPVWVSSKQSDSGCRLGASHVGDFFGAAGRGSLPLVHGRER
jgi:hypothetical protein